MSSWYLEGYFSGDGHIHRQPVQDTPFVMGRDEAAGLTISAGSISRRHAQINFNIEHISIEDLGSKNGTYVNHRRIEESTSLQHGDIIHLGDVEMRLMQTNKAREDDKSESTIIVTPDLSNKFPYGAKELEQILDTRQLTTAFQPIVVHDNSGIYGYEILGRGTSDLLPRSPGALFQVAESVGLEVRLSEMFRNVGVEIATELKLQGPLFINTHPSELLQLDQLISSIQALRARFPGTEILLEIHEQAISDVNAIKLLKAEMQKLQIKIAYDDFGVGQSRLLELVEATPQIIKFDMVLIDNIHLAEPAKIDLVKQLHQLARNLNIQTLAECLSKPEDYEVCKTVGFDFYQGFLFGVPQYPAEFN
ncbi:EAL domain-containing protein [Oceanicoccus sp. KOV_DT_Chl]|uniref:EAL domain-containing protein n=1 Tax=Oceanicoccus sp. KOV_DT_Chl TaxID=1904639 RepID=UPI000C7A83D5|nr:EAL domain-containing protein [Oceanicoccus sp. KOV_DT_Chl]